MPLDVIVCVKQVPDPKYFSKITLDPVTKRIRREGMPAVVNPLDRHALEEGLRIREKFSGKVTALSMGPPQAREALEHALAMGADDAILLCGNAFAGADTLATAYALAGAIGKLGHFDLILCGTYSADGSTGQVGPRLAELLDIPHITHATKIEFKDSRFLKVIRALEYGYLKIEVQLPALLAVERRINLYRLPSLIGIMEATEKEIKVWDHSDIGIPENLLGAAGSVTKVRDTFKQDLSRKGKILQGSAEDVAKEAVKDLYEMGVI